MIETSVVPQQLLLAQAPHYWIRLSAGRVCNRCHKVQPDGRFDDSRPCTP